VKWENGKLISDVENYKIPIIKDIPKEFNVYLLPNSSNESVVFSSKGKIKIKRKRDWRTTILFRINCLFCDKKCN
jgi:predicted methyltransferase